MVPYGKGILPAGYILDIVFHDDASGNITGTTYRVTDICGNTSSIGPVNIVGTSLAASGASGTIPASALAPMYGIQMNLVNMPGSTFVFSSGAGTISYRANEWLYVSNHQPSWTAAQGIVTGENSDIAYTELSSTPSNLIVQQFGLAQCECTGTSCELPGGSYTGSCTGCGVAASGSGCVLSCTSCGTLNGMQNMNPSLQLPCTGSLSNGAVSNNNGALQVQCAFVASADAGVETTVDAACGPGACVTPSGPYQASCTGCAAVSSGMDAGSGCVLTCTSCTEEDGGQNPDPSLPLPCSAPIENDNGALTCGGASDAGSGGHDGGSSGGQDGSIGGGDAGSEMRDAAADAGAASDDGGGSSAGPPPSGSGCSCSLAAIEAASPTQPFAPLALAALIGLGRRRKRLQAGR
jgi:MYXO-CTERM domain-containing protein